MTCPQLPAYLDELRRLRRNPATIYQVQRWVEGFWQFCQEQGVTELIQLQSEHLPRYTQSLLWAPHSKGGLFAVNTLYQMQQMVRAFLRWAWASGRLPKDPTRGLVLPRPAQPGPEKLSATELEKVLAQPDCARVALGLRDRALLEVFCRAGLTRDQAWRLDLADVELRFRVLKVGEQKTRTLTDPLAQALTRYLWEGRPQLTPQPGEVAVFVSKEGRRLAKAQITRLVRHYGDRAGIRALTPRSLAYVARPDPSLTPLFE